MNNRIHGKTSFAKRNFRQANEDYEADLEAAEQVLQQKTKLFNLKRRYVYDLIKEEENSLKLRMGELMLGTVMELSDEQTKHENNKDQIRQDLLPYKKRLEEESVKLDELVSRNSSVDLRKQIVHQTEEKSHAKNEVDIQQRKANSEMTNELKRYETCVQYKWIEKKDPVIQMYKNFDAFCQNLKATELTGIAKEFNSARKARDALVAVVAKKPRLSESSAVTDKRSSLSKRLPNVMSNGRNLSEEVNEFPSTSVQNVLTTCGVSSEAVAQDTQDSFYDDYFDQAELNADLTLTNIAEVSNNVISDLPFSTTMQERQGLVHVSNEVINKATNAASKDLSKTSEVIVELTNGQRRAEIRNEQMGETFGQIDESFTFDPPTVVTSNVVSVPIMKESDHVSVANEFTSVQQQVEMRDEQFDETSQRTAEPFTFGYPTVASNALSASITTGSNHPSVSIPIVPVHPIQANNRVNVLPAVLNGRSNLNALNDIVVNELSRNENIAPRSTARRQLTFYDSDDSIADLELSDSDEEPITELQHVDDTLNGSDVLEIHNTLNAVNANNFGDQNSTQPGIISIELNADNTSAVTNDLLTVAQDASNNHLHFVDNNETPESATVSSESYFANDASAPAVLITDFQDETNENDENNEPSIAIIGLDDTEARSSINEPAGVKEVYKNIINVQPSNAVGNWEKVPSWSELRNQSQAHDTLDLVNDSNGASSQYYN